MDLTETILFNWQNIFRKMENHIQKMSSRQLSLLWKVYLNEYTSPSKNNFSKQRLSNSRENTTKNT